MEARDVCVYFDCAFSQNQRFYNFYQCASEKIDLGEFLDNSLEEEEEKQEFNKIYGILHEEKYAVYRVVLTFYNTRDEKKYMVFTDGRKDPEGKVVVYGLMYDEEAEDPFLGYVQSKESWNDIGLIMDSMFVTKH